MAVILDEKKLGLLIKTIRKKAKLSQHELAELAGVGKTLILQFEALGIDYTYG